MQSCDVCNRVLPDGEGERVTPDVFSFFLDNGLGIHESNIRMLTEAGVSRYEAVKALKQQYRQSSSDWLLCAECASEALTKLAQQKHQWVSPDCISITRTAEEAEMGFGAIGAPVALNRDVWNEFVEWTDQDTRQQCYQEQEARLWDVVFTAAATLELEIGGFIKEGIHRFSIFAIPRDGISNAAMSVSLLIRRAEIRGQMWLVVEKAP